MFTTRIHILIRFSLVKRLKWLVCAERQRMNHCTNIHLRGESFANGLSVEMVLRFHSFLSEVFKRHPTGVKTAFCFQRVISEKMPFSGRLPY